MKTRRDWIQSLCRTAAVFSFDQNLRVLPAALPVQFVNVAREARLNAKSTYDGEGSNKYLLETTGCGAAFFEFDHDGWLDIFLVNGTRFDARYAPGHAPTQRPFKNNRDGTLPISRRRPALFARRGDKGAASSITTTTAGMICL